MKLLKTGLLVFSIFIGFISKETSLFSETAAIEELVGTIFVPPFMEDVVLNDPEGKIEEVNEDESDDDEIEEEEVVIDHFADLYNALSNPHSTFVDCYSLFMQVLEDDIQEHEQEIKQLFAKKIADDLVLEGHFNNQSELISLMSERYISPFIESGHDLLVVKIGLLFLFGDINKEADQINARFKKCFAKALIKSSLAQNASYDPFIKFLEQYYIAVQKYIENNSKSYYISSTVKNAYLCDPYFIANYHCKGLLVKELNSLEIPKIQYQYDKGVLSPTKIINFENQKKRKIELLQGPEEIEGSGVNGVTREGREKVRKILPF